MAPGDIVERLAGHRTLGKAPREELAWLAAHGTICEYAAGEVLSSRTAPVAGLFAILTGRVAFFMDRP